MRNIRQGAHNQLNAVEDLFPSFVPVILILNCPEIAIRIFKDQADFSCNYPTAMKSVIQQSDDRNQIIF